MKALVALALVATSLPMAAAPATAGEKASDRKICERLQTKTGSRMGHRRICLTRAQWVDKLGPDWRSRLAGYDLEADVAELDMLSKDFEPAVVFKPKTPL